MLRCRRQALFHYDSAAVVLPRMPEPDREAALCNLAIVFEHYNEEHPHSALGYRSHQEFRRLSETSV